jgi:hypothetical protein
MKYTNNHNLPEAICKAIIGDPYIKTGNYSATSLIKPPRMLALENRYHDHITEDVSDRLWALLGQSVHYVLERGNHGESICEARLSVEIVGKKLTGKPDLYHIADKCMEDYKITSVYSFLLGDKPEWEKQINILAYIYRMNGFPVEQGKIHAILRDHQGSKALSDSNYPPIPFMSVNVPIWDIDMQRAFIRDCILSHERAKELPDNELPECTESDRWYKGDTYAVMKEGNKKASKVCATEAEAGQYIANQTKGKFSLVKRIGASIRCERFCKVNKWCNQFPMPAELLESEE